MKVVATMPLHLCQHIIRSNLSNPSNRSNQSTPPSRSVRSSRSTQTSRPIKWLQVAAAGAAWIAIACSIVQPAAAAAATDLVEVTELRPLLILALERGQAHSVFKGAGAAYVQRRFDATSPIEIEVMRLHDLSQVGCARLEITTRQRSVMVNTKRQDQELVYQLSVCAGGHLLGEQ